MAACGICGSSQKQLYCGGCATHHTLRARVNVLNVSTQLSSLQESVANIIEGRQPNSEDNTRPEVQIPASVGNKAHMTRLSAQSELLMKKLEQINALSEETKRKTEEVKQKTQLILKSTKQLKKKSELLQVRAEAQFKEYDLQKEAKENELEKGYKDTMHLSLELQAKHCKELLDIFGLKKKRKKVGYEIVLGFNIIPELTQLGHYSVITINSGLERVSNFIMLLASYLGIRLPHDIIPPRKGRPYVLIGSTNEMIILPHSVKTMMRSSTKEFHHYCSVLAMLVMDVAHVALKLGIPGIHELSDVVKVNQLVAQIYLRLESLISEGHQIKIYSGFAPADIESIQDHLITAIDIEMNGKSAEWNIVEAPEEISSETDFPKPIRSGTKGKKR